jgi:glycosyltransferase involved in cell wall biosynthesis
MLFVCQDRAEELARQGHEVHVLTTAGPEEYEHNGVTIHRLGGALNHYSPEYNVACGKKCEELEPDIVHLDGVPTCYQMWWQTRPGDAEVYAATLHGFGAGSLLTAWNMYRCDLDTYNPEERLTLLRLEKEIKVLESLDVTVGISRAEHWYLTDLYGLPNTKLVYNPIPGYFFEGRREAVPDNGYFMCADLTRAACRNFNSADRVIREMGAELKAIKGVQRVDMPEFYDGARALILPTLYAQGYDLTVAEAEARGVPIICSATGSYFMESWGRPWIKTFRAGSDEALAAAIKPGNFETPPPDAADRHRPENHVKAWLEALGF